MQLKSRDVAKALKSKGFEEIQGNHRFFIFYTCENKKSPIQTMISQGGNHDLGDDLISKMASQCKLKKREFLQLVDCALDRDKYEEKLNADGEL